MSLPTVSGLLLMLPSQPTCLHYRKWVSSPTASFLATRNQDLWLAMALCMKLWPTRLLWKTDRFALDDARPLVEASC
ncbi:hypothetical protein C8J56DRAFT_977240 [Mycena floridula]|nr:hypothetical protein C8J56DRAFT_977240 [Mycena floridula]